MPKILCTTNQKGGVGKSTTCANLAAALSEEGKKILLIDLDPQAGLTTSLGYDPDRFEKTVYNVLIDPEGSPLRSVMVETSMSGVMLAPANLDLAAAEAELIGEIGWDRTLKEILYPVQDAFDYIIIDCPPSLGVLTANALVASDLAIIPLQAEYLAMRGLKQLNKIIQKVRKRSNPNLRIRILITMFDRRTTHAKEVRDEIAEIFGDHVSPIIINRTIKFADATIAGKPLTHYDPKSEGADAYRQLAKEVSSLCPSDHL